MATGTTSRPILFFDGECNLCNGAVQFVIKHDRQKRFLFSPLQTTAGAEALKNTPVSASASYSSVILLYNGKYLTRSAAALTVLRLLGGGWAMLYGTIIVPRFIRDGVYDLIARNRYKWFGKRKECMIPTAEIMERFLR